MDFCKDCSINDRLVSSSGKKYSYCLECHKLRTSEYQKSKEGKESLKRSIKKYRDSEKGRETVRKVIRNYQRKKNGFTAELFEEKIIEQDYKCDICKKDIHKSSHADHNHITNKARGILCPGCNTLLGRLEAVGFDWVEKAKEYLKKY